MAVERHRSDHRIDRAYIIALLFSGSLVVCGFLWLHVVTQYELINLDSRIQVLWASFRCLVFKRTVGRTTMGHHERSPIP